MAASVRLTLAVDLVLESPFLMAGLDGAAFGFDAAQLRNHEGEPVLSGDQLRGVLRQAMVDLVKAAPDATSGFTAEVLFGKEGIETGKSGSIVVGDLIAKGLQPRLSALPRVAIDDETGSAKAGHLQTIELVAPVGEEVAFQGEIIAFVAPETANELPLVLERALRLVPAIGAYKTAGFGRIVQATIRTGATADLQLPAVTRDDKRTRYVWRFTFDRPLMVSSDLVEGNVFRSDSVISGAVLKGALAQRLKRAGLDPGSHPFEPLLRHMMIGHAFPGKRVGRALPRSIVSSFTGDHYEIRDALFDGDLPALINGRAPVFLADMKSDGVTTARNRLGWPTRELEHVIRTRTAIDPSHGTAAEAQLFSYQMVETKGIVWQSVVDTGRCPESDELRQLLTIMGQYLDEVGKTDAILTTEGSLEQLELPTLTSVPGQADHYALMLETPALIFGGDDLSDSQRFQVTLADYFDQQSQGKLKLSAAFTEQSLAGGWIARRFRADATTYMPWILLDPGSVFLLVGEEGPLPDWLRYGLPLPDWADALGWRDCPYQRENGFGKISLNAAEKLWDIDRDTRAA